LSYLARTVQILGLAQPSNSFSRGAVLDMRMALHMLTGDQLPKAEYKTHDNREA